MRLAWQKENPQDDLTIKLRRCLCEQDLHFIFCFLILILVFIICMIMYSGCNYERHGFHYKQAIEYPREKSIYNESTVNGVNIVPEMSTLRSNVKADEASDKSTFPKQLTSETSTLTTVSTETMESDWFFPSFLKKLSSQDKPLIRPSEEDDQMCNLLLTFLAISSFGVILLLLLWCFVLLYK